jgi:hypothetical protein
MAPRRRVSSKDSPPPADEEPPAPVEGAKPVEILASTNDAEPAATFTLYQRLPPELRLKVWSCTIVSEFVDIKWNATKRLFTSDRKPPSILSVNRESRAIGLEHYQVSVLHMSACSSV